MVIFSLLLVSIPYLIYKESPGLAKGVGVVLVILVTWRIRSWVFRLRKQKGRPDKIDLNANDRFFLQKEIAFYQTLDKQEKKIFESRVALFLTSVAITEIGKEVPDRETGLWVASSAVIAFWGLPFWNYGRLAEVLVYPSRFDDDQQLEVDGRILGKVFHGGLMDTTMILSKPDLIRGFRDKNDKRNVGIHEFAHLLDKANGAIDGVPEGMTKSLQEVWEQVCVHEIEAIVQGKSDLDPYVLENRAEFFAVLVEYYREQPQLLQRKYPVVFRVLDAYFRK